MGHCHIDSGVSFICWKLHCLSANWKNLLHSCGMCTKASASSPLPCSLAVALLRIHQEVCSQLVLCGGPDGGLPPLYLCLLTGEILMSWKYICPRSHIDSLTLIQINVTAYEHDLNQVTSKIVGRFGGHSIVWMLRRIIVFLYCRHSSWSGWRYTTLVSMRRSKRRQPRGSSSQ